MFAVSLIVAFLAAFSAGASKTFSDSPSSFLRSLNSLKPVKSSLIITSVHLIGGFVFGTYILGTYEQLIVKVDHDDRAKLVVGAFATIVAFAFCNFLFGALRLNLAINICQVSAIVGSALVLIGPHCVPKNLIWQLLIAWLIFPVISIPISVLTYWTVTRAIIEKSNPIKYGLASIPYFFGISITLPLVLVFANLPIALGLGKPSWIVVAFFAVVCASLVIMLAAILFVPRARKKILAKLLEMRANNEINSRDFASRSKCFVNTTFDSSETLGKFSLSSAINLQAGNITLNELQNNTNKLQATTTGASNQSSYQNQQQQLDLGRKSVIIDNSVSVKLNCDQLIELAEMQAPNTNFNINQSNTNFNSTSSVQNAGSNRNSQRLSSRELSQVESQRVDIGRIDRIAIEYMFRPLQYIAGTLSSLSHGSNDCVSIVVPLVAILNLDTLFSLPRQVQVLSTHLMIDSTYKWILILTGNLGFCLALTLLTKHHHHHYSQQTQQQQQQQQQQQNVSKQNLQQQQDDNINEDTLLLNPSQEFSVDFGASMSTIIASILGWPINFEHCKIMSMISVGIMIKKICKHNQVLSQIHFNDANDNMLIELKILSIRNVVSLILNLTLPALISACASYFINSLITTNNTYRGTGKF